MGTGYQPDKKLWVPMGNGFRPDKKLWVTMGTGYQLEKKFWVLIGTGYNLKFFLGTDGYCIPAKFSTMPTPVPGFEN